MKLKNKEIYVNNLKLSFLNFFSISLMRISRFYYKSDSTKNKQTNKQKKNALQFSALPHDEVIFKIVSKSVFAQVTQI